MRKATEADDRLGWPTRTGVSTSRWSRLGGNRQLAALYESILVRIQLYMAVNLRREAEAARAADGVHRHERLFEAVERGDPAAVLAALAAHGARTYLT